MFHDNFLTRTTKSSQKKVDTSAKLAFYSKVLNAQETIKDCFINKDDQRSLMSIIREILVVAFNNGGILPEEFTIDIPFCEITDVPEKRMQLYSIAISDPDLLGFSDVEVTEDWRYHAHFRIPANS